VPGPPGKHKKPLSKKTKKKKKKKKKKEKKKKDLNVKCHLQTVMCECVLLGYDAGLGSCRPSGR
jgi:hypothetical protein